MVDVRDAIKIYESKFKVSFPTIPILLQKTDEEVMEIISKCVSENKDVYELGYLSLEEYY